MQHINGHLRIVKNILDKIKDKVDINGSFTKEEICEKAKRLWKPWKTCPAVERTESYTAVILARILKSPLLEDNGCSKDELALEMGRVLKDCSEEEIKGAINLLIEMGELVEYDGGKVKR